MKKEYSITCAFCVVLIVISLLHLYHYGRCRRTTMDMAELLKETSRSNHQMRGNILEQKIQLDQSRKFSSKAIIHHQNRVKNVKHLQQEAHNVLTTLDRGKQIAQGLQRQVDENNAQLRAIKIQQEVIRQRQLALAQAREEERKRQAKILKPTIPPLEEQDYLLIEPNQ